MSTRVSNLRVRKQSRVWVLVAMAALGAACRADQRQTGGARTPSTSGAALRIVSVEVGERLVALEEIVKDYNRTHPGPPFVVESIGGGGSVLLNDKVRTNMAAGNPPHIFQNWPGEIVGPFIDAGHLRAVDHLYKKYGWDEFLIPWTTTAVERHGQRWGIPTNSHGMTFWYRKDVFARFGLREPDTYQELELICTTLRKNDIDCIALGGKYGWLTMRLLDFFLELTCGPELHDRINRLEASWDRPEVVAAYKLLRAWIDRDWISRDFLTIAPADARLPFYRGDAAMVFEGDWLEPIMILEDEQDIAKYDFFLPPTNHEPRRFSGFAELFAVVNHPQHQDRVDHFLDWYLQPPVQERTLDKIGWTARRSVPLDEERWPRTAKWRRVLAEGQAFRPTDQMFPREVMDAWFAVQDGVVAKMIEPAEAARRAQEIMGAHKQARERARAARLSAENQAANPGGRDVK
jgi:raffinose/stachyose/melibiose transport system substrate-binding protein